MMIVAKVLLCPHCYAKLRCKCCGSMPERLNASQFSKDDKSGGDFEVCWSDEDCKEHRPQ